jgi:hypothetical protein
LAERSGADENEIISEISKGYSLRTHLSNTAMFFEERRNILET